VIDPTTGQGIGDALRDAELLADAIGDGLGGRRPLAAALAGYEQARDQAALAMYEFTTELAALGPPSRRCSPPWRAAGRDQSVPRRDHRRGANRLLHSEESAPSPRCPRDGHRDAQQAAPAATGDSAARGSGKALRPEGRLCSPSRAHESTPAGWCSQRGPAPASRHVCSKAVTMPTIRSSAVLSRACLDRHEPAITTAWAPASAIRQPGVAA
jgi:hypothetical protein